MDYRQLELFLAAAERLNLSQAAEAMNISQPGLSKSMDRLQSELGARLYQRDGRGIALTQAGRALHRHVSLIEAQMREARAEVIGIARGSIGHARIGAGPSWLSRHLPESIAAIMANHPSVQFTVETGFPDKLIGRLRDGALDAVVGALPENRVDPDLRFMRLTDDVNRVIGRAGHPLLQRAERSLADYAAQRWVLPGPREMVRLRLNMALVKAGFAEPVPALETDSLSLILATLRLTDCIALTTTQLLIQGEAEGIVAIDHEALRFARDAGVITRRHAVPSPSVKLLIGELRKITARQDRN